MLGLGSAHQVEVRDGVACIALLVSMVGGWEVGGSQGLIIECNF